MRIIAEEDLQRGVDPMALAACERCRAARPLVGSIAYDGIRLCNACATRFEVARLNGEARSCAAFVGTAAAVR